MIKMNMSTKSLKKYSFEKTSLNKREMEILKRLEDFRQNIRILLNFMRKSNNLEVYS